LHSFASSSALAVAAYSNKPNMLVIAVEKRVAMTRILQ
jgi:hypothetical protein